ncbi:3-deoxy-D-manno-octulosonate 8-phosphate phosphatase [hydrothermal vent metagenome]|uniref:3-deoxy-D-manno-octulosonate 8-phosphate phosphatase KdsC n=1 Tax=hydrothermal vent metagenome TaxID=652676 RepID=A0A1W1CG15_9ZZZZ
MSIELIVLDVDGTMTNSQITYSQNGDEIKSFNVKDGLAIVSWMKLGKKVAIITGRKSKIVEKRAKELHIEYYYQGIENKLEVLLELTEKLNITMDSVATIGDDLNDYKILEASKISFVPQDASEHVERIATVSLIRRGGDGAVREMIEYLISKEGLTKKYLNLWV